MNKKVSFLALVLCVATLITGCQKPHVHSFSDEWSTNETEHWHAALCEHEDSEPGELETERGAHIFSSWEAVTPATCEADGLEHRTCEICGYEETNVLPKASEVSTDWKLKDPLVAICGGVEINLTKKDDIDFLFLPTNNNLTQVSILGAYDGILSTVTDTYTVLAGQTVSVDFSVSQNFSFECVVNGVGYRKSVRVKASENIRSFYMTVDKNLSTITNEDATASTGSLSVISAEGEVTEIGEFTKFLKRGNLSYRKPEGKYSYKFKLNKKAALLQNPNGEDVKAKSWILLANNVSTQDLTGFSNVVGYETYFNIGGNGAVSLDYVNLYINGVYQGVYQLVEKNTTEAEKSLETLDEDQINSDDPSVPLTDENAVWETTKQGGYGATYNYCVNATSTKKTGFVVENERYVDSKPGGYVITTGKKVFTVKAPNYPTKEQMRDLAAWLQGFEDALNSSNGINSLGKSVCDYLDMESMAKSFIANMFVGNGDYLVQSTFYSLDYDSNGQIKKLESANVWDMNGLVNSGDVANEITWTTEPFRQLLLKNGEFVAELYKQFAELDRVLDSEYTRVSELYSQLKPAMKLNQMLYGVNFTTEGQQFLDDFKDRITKWRNAWSDQTGALRGVTVSKDGNTLVANATSATKYQWYRVGSNGYTGSSITGATSATYTPTKAGTYYVKVTGKALPGNATSETMYSSPVRVE